MGRARKRQRRQRSDSGSADSDSSFILTPATAATTSSRKSARRQTNGQEEDEDSQTNDSFHQASSEYRTRSGRKSSYRVGVTICKKKVGRPRKLDRYRSDDDDDEDDEMVNYDHAHFEEEIPDESSEDEDSQNEVEGEEEEEEIDEEDDEANVPIKKRPAREAPATLFMDNVKVPELTLPPSSEDVLIKGKNLMRTVSIYEILRRFQQPLRLTPFRFEDFCVSLLIDEQTYLLSEIHIQLLKALIREDDLVGTQHGPQDVRDSINIYLYLCDPMTWPEVTRVYLSSDYRKNSKILADSLAVNYPFASLEQKLSLLEYFCEEFLVSANCRDVLNNEGRIQHDDNCRSCHRTGDLLCCDTCPAVFHLNCLDPPLKQVPEEAWTCPICTLNSVNGVTDCVSDLEKLGYCSRQEPIGWDRHGRRYWFLCRRLIVEDQKDSENVIYYSSRLQFDELMASLDAENYENDLCTALEEQKDEIYRQMLITEQLTKLAKGTRKSYLEATNEELFLKRETQLKLKIEETEGEEKKTFEEQLIDLESKLAVDESDSRNNQLDNGNGMLTRIRTGTIQPKAISMDSFKNRISSYNNFSAVRDEETMIILKEEVATADNTNSSSSSSSSISLTRTPRKALPANFNAMNLFKLGIEGNYRQYQNIYSLNKYALNKAQLAEERDKRRHLSHKFSLTTLSDLKWATYTQINTALTTTSIYGTRSVVVNILRQALLYLETQLSSMFMHPSWPSKRLAFTKAVSMCSETSDFSLALQTLESAMKPVLLNTVWFESLGFGTALQRSTQAERDELKKREKKDRRDGALGAVSENMTAENEAAAIAAGRSSAAALAAGVGVRLVCGKLKHQIWKQKGEEFRLSGIGGWQWVSSTRVKPDLVNSERPTLKKEEEEELPEEKMDTDEQPSVIDISKALSESSTEPQKDRKYLKVTSSQSARLDSLLKSRLDMYSFDKKKEKEATAAAAAAAAKKAEEEQKAAKTKDSSNSSTYRCYSPLCHSASESSQQKCYSPLCLTGRKEEKTLPEKKDTDEAVVEQKQPSTLDDTTEHVDLLEVKAVGVNIVPTAVQKIVPFKSVLLPSTRFKVGKYRSMLILPLFEMRKLGRNGGLLEVIGFNYNCKSNNAIWPYGLTPRPNLRTMWLFRTACMGSLHAAALQLRVFWAAVRWDDLLNRPQHVSSTKTITTESEVTTVEILKRRDLPPFGLRSQYLIRKIIVPIDLPSTPREVSTPSRSGLRQRKRPASPQVRGPRMEETWLDEEGIELWEIRQFADKAIMEERKRQIELKQKAAAAELQQRRNNAASTPVSAVNKTQLANSATKTYSTSSPNASALNINPKQAISSRLSSIFQNRAANKVLATSPVINSGTIMPTSIGATTYATIRTANGTFRVPVQNKPGSPANQFIIRPGTQIISSTGTAGAGAQPTFLQGANVIVSSSSGAATLTTPTRPGATYAIVRTPNVSGAGAGMGTARPIIMTANNAAIIRSSGISSNPNVKQAVPLITSNMPQKISTGTTVNAILATNSSQQPVKSVPQQATAAAAAAVSTATSTIINLVSASNLQSTAATAAATIGKGIQCVQLKTNDGRTHLVPISSLPSSLGQTFQVAFNSGSSMTTTPLRFITTSKPAGDAKGPSYLISSPLVGTGANGAQKVVLQSSQQQQQQQPTSSITLTNPTSTTDATDAAKTMVTPATTTAAAAAPSEAATTTTTLISPTKPTVAEPPKEFELTPEVTQEIVRKALMDASLPLGTSQKLLAYQKRHRQLNKLGDNAAATQEDDAHSSSGGSSKAIKYSSSASGRNYSTPTSRLMESVSSHSGSRTTTSRSSRYSRGNSRYDNSDFITDFGSSKKDDRLFEEEMDFEDLDEVDRICAGVLKGLIDKVEKSEKMARRAELREERTQKQLALNKLKFRQSHIEVMRRRIERRKAKLNISIRRRVENELNGQLGGMPTTALSGKRKFKEDDDSEATLNLISPSKSSSKASKAKRPKVTVTPSSFPTTNGVNSHADTATEASTNGQPKFTRMKTIKKGKTTKLFCVCKQPFEDDRFMIGCDVCKNWFHPECVQMSSADLARQQNLWYTCPSCVEQSAANSTVQLNGSSEGTSSTATNSARKMTSIRQIKKAMKSQPRGTDIPLVAASGDDPEPLPGTYCVCQRAYDATQFYICCDRCQGWFHGRCVGITAAVAESIADYTCPNCEDGSKVSLRNIRQLSEKDFASLKAILKSVQLHKEAWPFLIAVPTEQVPDYYTIIKEPIDLSLIDRRLSNREYRSLAEFIYDMNKMFDNCRLYNARTTPYYHSAEVLENFFTKQLKAFRRKS